MTNIKIKKYSFINILYVTMLVIGIVLLVIFPKLAINSFYDGLRIWATSVLPALLPFFILTKLLSYTNFIKVLGKYLTPFTQKMYGVGGVAGYVFVMSIISGYPVGARITADLYNNKIITKGQAYSITSFTSTSGPLFIIGTVAIGLYNNSTIGIIIIVSHIIGAILNGLLYKNKDVIQTCQLQTTTNNLAESMSSSILSIMSVGGFIALFYMILQLILKLNILYPIVYALAHIGVSQEITLGIFAGIVEVTSGCLFLSNAFLPVKALAILSTFLISFGGLSIHAQAYTYLKDFEMPYRKFLCQKLTQAVISSIVAFLLCIFL